MELIDVIKSIQSSLHYNYINHGGCIHFAYFMSQQLTKYKVKHKLVAILACGEKVSNIEFIGCRHLVIYIPEIGYIDSNLCSSNINRFPYYDPYISKVPKTYDLNKIRLIKGLWNPTYNRKYNGTMSRVIKSAFKKLKNDNRRSRL